MIRKASTKGVNQTVIKHLFYLFAFLKEPVKVTLDDKEYIFGDYDEFLLLL